MNDDYKSPSSPADEADALIKDILTHTSTIAVVGASANPDRPSYQVMQYLQSAGYRLYPVNPGHAGSTILGETVYASLTDVPAPVDMVDVFRQSDAVLPIVKQAIAIGARTVWMQLGVINHDAAAIAEKAGLNVIMDRCPKIEHPRLIAPFNQKDRSQHSNG